MATSTNTLQSEAWRQGWLKPILLAALVIGICWIGVLAYWRAFHHTPDTADLGIYLLALPLALLTASGLARARLAKPASAAEAPPLPLPAQATNIPPPLAMLAAALRLPHGESPGELSDAIFQHKAGADLDPDLVDQDGFPVMTARTHEAVDDLLQQEITEWWTANGNPQPSLGDEQWRALTLASAVAAELASSAARDLLCPGSVPPLLHVLPILPAGWGAGQRRAAAMWLRHTIAQSGWPSDSIVMTEERPTDYATPAEILGQLARQATDAAPLVALLVACDSNIGTKTVAQWEEGASLFTASRPHGQIPGEGAAGLLLIDLKQARSLDDVLFTLLDAMFEAQRDRPAGETRRAAQAQLAELAGRALQHAAIAASEVAMLVADTGQASDRVLELMAMASGEMPLLDGEADLVRVGAASGTCGVVPFVAALALGRHHALERAAPVLCMSNEDPSQRYAVLVRPYASA